MDKLHKLNENQSKIDLKTVQKSIQKSIKKMMRKIIEKMTHQAANGAILGSILGPVALGFPPVEGHFFEPVPVRVSGGTP